MRLAPKEGDRTMATKFVSLSKVDPEVTVVPVSLLLW